MKKRKLNKKGKLLIIFITILLIMLLNAIIGTNTKQTSEIRPNTQGETKVSKNTVKNEIKDKPQVCGLSTIKCEEDNETDLVKEYRLTSYYTNDPTGSGEWVGAGIHTSKFQINDKGWYTYKGKLVLAGATNECLNATTGACNKWNIPKSDKHYYNYYDEVEVIIDGTSYEGIILDSCGACMYLDENRIDLFVSNKESSIDRGYRGVNEIKVVNK
jgi:hypothetical protein